MSNPPVIITGIPKGHPAVEQYLERGIKNLQGRSTPAEIEDFKRRARENPEECLKVVTCGPREWSGGLPYVKPEIEQSEDLAKVLGLDTEGGWRSVWKEMDQNRERLCTLVWRTLEWSDEKNAGNTFTYCFCTKYLPLIVQAVLEDPSPSVFATPYDFLLRGAAQTPLLQHFLTSRPDQAVRLRDAYYKNHSSSFGMYSVYPFNLDANACVTHLIPHLAIIYTCIFNT